MSLGSRTQELLADLGRRPGHDEVKADFRELLVEESARTGRRVGAANPFDVTDLLRDGCLPFIKFVDGDRRRARSAGKFLCPQVFA